MVPRYTADVAVHMGQLIEGCIFRVLSTSGDNASDARGERGPDVCAAALHPRPTGGMVTREQECQNDRGDQQ